MNKKLGFTLVELLVVIAIISILAAIIVPRVSGYIARANMTAAETEIQTIELQIAQILADTSRSNLGQIFDPVALDSIRSLSDLEAATEIYTNVMYSLLRLGRGIANDADFGGYIDPEVVKKLAKTYQEDLGKDPWDRKYLFFAGPLSVGPMPFRSWRNGIENGDSYLPYVYDFASKAELDQELPGNPPADDLYGYPAPRNIPAYVWSTGADLTNSQLVSATAADDPEKSGGGDDINNWDKERGWSPFYGN